MRSLMSLLTLSAVFGYLTMKSNVLRAILFFSGIPIAVFVNIVRVVLLICFLYFFNIDLTHGDMHVFFGLGVYALALILLFIVKEMLVRWNDLWSKD